jgi:hypothetical protein
MQATNMQFTLDEDQWEQDWASVLSLASQPGASLEQTHVFALAHIIRRPIIIYGVKFVRSFRGETLGLARFQGRGVAEHVFLFTLLSHLTNENKLILTLHCQVCTCLCFGRKVFVGKVRSFWDIQEGTSRRSLLWRPNNMVLWVLVLI